MTQQYHLASMAAQLSSTCISHHNLLPHIPSISLSIVKSSPCPGVVPRSLNFTSQPLRLLGNLRLCLGHVCMHVSSKDCLILILFRLPQISCFSLSLECSSSDSDNCPDAGIGPLLQFRHQSKAGPVLQTLLFFSLVPSSYRVLHDSIHSFRWSGTPVCSQLVF